MKLITVTNGTTTQIGVMKNETQYTLLDPGKGWPTSMVDLLQDPESLTRLRVTGEQKFADELVSELDGQKLLAPISEMEKLICIGTNYADHAREMGGEPSEIPIVFNKFPSAIAAPESEIVLPSISEKVDFEAELVVVIGKTGKNISRANAMEFVFGYCCGNDISARDWQKGKPGGQWLLGKTFDSFAPIGPMIVTRDEISDPHNLRIQLRLNGEAMQDSNTKQLIFPIDFLIAHVSQFATLKPGDLIFTGTPSGVGAGRKPPLFLKSGDQLEVEIEEVGILKNSVIAAKDC